MIIIADTSCLIALEKIDSLFILQKLFGTVYVSQQVADEYELPLPEWLKIKALREQSLFSELKSILDEGESSAIALALENENSVLIIDEKKGRAIAAGYNIKIIGTLKILLLARQKGLLPSLKHTIAQLEMAGFRFSKKIVESLLRLASE